ncbi:MAG: hypothetical protein Q8867_01670, partial [Bacteroidota bacterium]|nr:hypothetical protein [Bacteroidota bacterium]
SIASYIAQSDPKIQQVFESWKNLTPDALLSNLEKNQDLKSALLQETPWVAEASSESQQKQKIAALFDVNTMKAKLEDNLSKLKKMQLSDGAWPWFDGMPENSYITRNIVTGLAHLDHLGVKNIRDDRASRDMMTKAVRYLDIQIEKDYDLLKKYPGKMNENHLGPDQIQYLYCRSYFMKDIPLESSTQKAFDYFRGQAEKYWLKNDLYFQGMIALALNRLGNTTVPEIILRSLSEKALHSPEMGMYWAAVAGYEWYHAPVETQALLIEAYDEVKADRASVDEMKIWLLKQKQTQNWQTGRATADAVYALLLKGSNFLSSVPDVLINLGNDKIDPKKLMDQKVEAGTGYFQVTRNGREIRPDMGNLTITKTGEGIAWGALYWQYFENLDKISSAPSALKLEKKIFLEKNTSSGPVLTEIGKSSGEVLHAGDRLKVRIVLTVDRNLEYVHLKDMRASALEPGTSATTFSLPGGESEQLSGYRYKDGLGYYQATTDQATNFFFDYLPKGTFVFEYPLVVNAAGEYSNGIATVQCLYAPEFSSHSGGIHLSVK